MQDRERTVELLAVIGRNVREVWRTRVRVDTAKLAPSGKPAGTPA